MAETWLCPSGHFNRFPDTFCGECGAAQERAVGDELETTRMATSYRPAQDPGVTGVLPAVPVGGFGGPVAGAPGPKRKIWPIVSIAVLGVAVVGLVVAVLLTSQGSSTSHSAVSSVPSTSTSTSTTSTSTTIPVTTTTVNQQIRQEAVALNSLLSNSAQDRTQIVSAARNIAACGDLNSDQNVLNEAQQSRQNLVNQLTSQQFGALPSGLINYLQQAWIASANADSSYSAWAGDEQTAFNGCTTNDTGDSNYQAATQYDQQATAAKSAFLAIWNQFAPSQGLPGYTASQI